MSENSKKFVIFNKNKLINNLNNNKKLIIKRNQQFNRLK